MWAKRFRTLVRKIRQVRQNSLLRTRKIYLTKLIFLKRIFNVTFSDFQPFFFSIFSKFWEGFPELRSSYPENFLDKNCISLGKTVEKNFLSICLRKIEQKIFDLLQNFFATVVRSAIYLSIGKIEEFFLLAEKHVI